MREHSLIPQSFTGNDRNMYREKEAIREFHIVAGM